MTPHLTSEAEPESSGPVPDNELGAGRLGSSVYGGRPTFGLVRRDTSDGATVTLYELLPESQAAARRARLERMAPHRSLVTEPFEEVFAGALDEESGRWSWADWTAGKVTRLSGTGLRTILPLVRETLRGADIDESGVTSASSGGVLVPETVGVRLALGFLGVKPLQRVDRMRAFCRGLARMSDEECYYWHAKCRSPSSPNGEKALRMLLVDHI
ncbi:MAG: hypothetical protein V5A27_00200 [Halapricum sp.]